MSRPATRQLDWPEKFAVVAVVIALIVLLVYGGSISAIAFALCGFMGWTRMFEQVRAQGKPALSDKGRVIVASLLFLVGVLAIPSDAKDASRATTATDRDATSSVVASGNQTTGEPGRSNVAEGRKLERQNTVKINSLLSDLKSLKDRDYEARLAFWNDIVALAPANAEYARKRLEMANKVKSLDVLRENPEEGAVVENVRGRKEGFGNVLVVDITLRNDALSNLKNFQITCESKGHSGTVVDSNTQTLYEIVDARSTRTFRKVNMGLLHSQAASTHCTVDQAAIA
ncbi:hypothetical protein [Sphingomonas sp. CFBP 13733]|uniref:hypothetical protein n=1 Tax=Sphingomonas sp. CFBP 13733 TaxID=2775291 RepID=UPI0017844A4D|nr:hypothetical protein [Sphingomonas sp. CFBP 13733]MBD8638203.1 hypothetical protein [Sphingomonas sp. CFBP 13733]